MSRGNYVFAIVLAVLIWMRISDHSKTDFNQAQQGKDIVEDVELYQTPKVTSIQSAERAWVDANEHSVIDEVRDEASIQNIGPTLDVPDRDRSIRIGSNQDTIEDVSNVGENIPLGFIDPLENFLGESKSVGEPLDPDLPEVSSIYVAPIDAGPILDIPPSSAQ